MSRNNPGAPVEDPAMVPKVKLARPPRHQHTPRQILKAWIGGSIAIMAISVLWSGGWLLSTRLAVLWGMSSVPWWLGLAQFLLTLLTFGFLAGTIGRIVNGRRMDLFQIIDAAFSRVAQGDFSVTVDLGKEKPGHPMDGFASNFNSMVISLREMEEMRQDFIATVSHELQSPLTSIGGFAAALRSDGLDPATRTRYLDIIEQQSRRLSLLTESLLKLSSLDSQGLAPERQRYALDEQIRTVILAAEPQWTQRDLRLEIDLAAQFITADQAALERVWTNLFHNAIKYTPAGGTIRLSLVLEDGKLRFDCTDSGLGIAAEDLPRVFDRFFKADKARSLAGSATGSGLGLAIAQKIVELHGGRIAADSPGLGQGSSFTVWLDPALD